MDSRTTEDILKELEGSTSTSHVPWGALLKCVQQNNSIQAVASMKKFGHLLKKVDLSPPAIHAEVSQCVTILTQLFTMVDPKGALCRALASILQGLPGHVHQEVVDKLNDCLAYRLDSATLQDNSTVVCNVHMIGAFMENFKLGEKCLESCYNIVLDFLIMGALQSFYKSARESTNATMQTELMQCCLAAIKTTMAVIQKCVAVVTEELKSEESNCRCTFKVLIELAWKILSDDLLIADCRSAAGMAIPLVWKVLYQEDYTLANKVIEVMNGGYALSDDQPGTSSKTFTDLSPSSQLFVCHGVLAMIPIRNLVQMNDNQECLLLDVILPKILQVTTISNDSSTTLAASRTLTLWTTIALTATSDSELEHSGDVKGALIGTSSIPQVLLQYVWTNWDHPVDGMRHQTRIIFENVVILQRQTSSVDPSKDPFLADLLEDLMGVSWHIRGKYGPLGCLAQHLGAEKIMGLYPSLHSIVLDMLAEQNLVPYACDLLNKLFTCHQNELTSTHGTINGLSLWQEIWIQPALQLLCDPNKSKHQKGFLVEYHVPKLLKFSPESLPYIVKHLQHDQRAMNSDQLGALLICLKTARTLGLIETKTEDSKDRMWKGLVSFDVLEQALCHTNAQVQLNALGLVCDSNKTTEQFTEDELRLVSTFITLNMNNSSPSFRQQMCAHLKKMLIRLRESGRLLSKQASKRCSADSDDQCDVVVLQVLLYKNFVQWFCEFQFTNLEPGASYPRRATALHILTMVVQIFNNPNKQGVHQSLFITQDMWTPKHVQLMMMRLTDNYDSNKVMTFDLLKNLSQETLGLNDRPNLDSVYDCSLVLASTNNPHSCESAANFLRILARQVEQPLKVAATSQEQCIMGMLQDLCKLLRDQVSIAKESLLEASVQGPMYGMLHCIREILGDIKFSTVSSKSMWQDMLHTIITLCFDVAQIASTIVCNSSPEGYLPSERNGETVSDVHGKETSDDHHQDIEDSESPEVAKTDVVMTLQVTPQMVLVCCWRSMKEVSLLLGQLVLDVPIAPQDGITNGLITEKQIIDIGELFLQLLKESKHRGAFELAYVGFVKLCTKLWRSSTQSLCGLPNQWLEGLMNDVTSDQPMLCATRRSAGIPFAIQAILNSEPVSFNKQQFKSVMSRLLNLALPSTDGHHVSATSQVHALNILRALYRDTHHGEDVFPYVGDGMRAAILGFQAELWAVRNSATMLFSALITRIFGVKKGKEEQARKNCMTGREFFSRFPALHGFLLTQLMEAAQKIDSSSTAHLHPALFPVLLLLSRLYPSAMDGSDSSLSMAVFVPHVLRCAGSAVYKTRCIAARALVAVVPSGSIPDMLRQLLDALSHGYHTSQGRICQNYIHGLLVQIQCLLSAHFQSGNVSASAEVQMSVVSGLATQIEHCLWLATSDNQCYITRSAMLNVLNTIISDQFYPKSSASSASSSKKDTTDSLLKLMKSVTQVVLSNITEAREDVVGRHQVLGYVEWQTANTQLYLNICGGNKTVGYLWEDVDPVESYGLEKDFREVSLDSNPNDFGAPLKEYTIGIISGVVNDGKCKPCDTDDEAIRLVSSLISSPHYEVRELTLGIMLNDCMCTANDTWTQDDSTETCKTNLGSQVIHSDDIFHVLVAMVMGRRAEDHPGCIEKALLLLNLHPLSNRFPWVLPGHLAITCVECFNEILQLASQENQRNDIVCAALRLTSTLLPSLCHQIKSEGLNESTSEGVSTWSNLLDGYSEAEHSNKCRIVIANILSKLAGLVLVDGHQLFGYQIPFRLWGVVIRLLQDDDVQVQLAACQCVKETLAALPHEFSLQGSISKSSDFQPNVAIQVCLSIMTRLYIQVFPRQYLETLVAWLIGLPEDQGIVGNEGASVGADKNNQIPEERLFDRGEANNNFEHSLLGKAILDHLEWLAATVTVKTDHPDVAIRHDAEPGESTSGATSVKEINTDRASDHSVWGKAQGSGGANPRMQIAEGLHPLGLRLENLTPNTRQDLVTAAKEMTGKILIALENFLHSMGDVKWTTPYLCNAEYECNYVECWCLLAGLLGLGLIAKRTGGADGMGDLRAKRGQLVDRVVAQFGGEQYCNLLILKVVNDIKTL